MIKKTLKTIFVVAAIACLSHFAEAQTPKAKPVKKLIKLTLPAHPSISMNEQMALLPKTKAEQKDEVALKENQIGYFDSALKVNSKLTTAQKTFVKANYERLGKIVDKQLTDRDKTDLPVGKWVTESLQKSFTAKFTNKELSGLITFFQATAGQRVLKFVKTAKVSEMSVERGGQPFYAKEDKAEHDKFAATPRGKKFLAAFLDDTKAYVEPKQLAVWGGYQEPALVSIMAPENLNKIIIQFVTENYKK